MQHRADPPISLRPSVVRLWQVWTLSGVAQDSAWRLVAVKEEVCGGDFRAGDVSFHLLLHVFQG